MSAESPRPDIRLIERTKPDPEAVQQELRRRKAEQVPADLRYSIEQRVAERVGPMQRIQR